MPDNSEQNSKVLQLYAQFRRVAALLTALNPVQGELLHGRAESKALATILRRGNGIVRFEGPGDEITYIVVRDGTRYTTKTRPIDAKEEEILVESVVTTKDRPVLNHLRGLAQKIIELSPQGYHQLRIERIVTNVESFQENTPSAQAINEAEGSHGLTEILNAHPEVGQSKDATRAWSLAAYNRIVGEFGKLNMIGDWAREALGTLTFVMLHPDPVAPYQVGTAQGEELYRFLSKELPERSVARPTLPILSIGFYLCNPQTSGRGSFIAAKHAGRVLRKWATANRRAALAETSVVGFHEKLFAAFVQFRAAQWVYDEIQFVAAEAPGIWDEGVLDKDEVRKGWVETEESRVAILASLHMVALPLLDNPNIADPSNFFLYLDFLRDNFGAENAKLRVHDMAVRLICPDPLKELALAFLCVRDGSDGTRFIPRVLEFINKVEAELDRLFLIGEPNYLYPAYQTISSLFRIAGRIQEAEAFDQRLSEDFAKTRLAEIFGKTSEEPPG
jgi:hypothetical protein